jgi:SSS family solute:Na+ symporter
VTHPIEVAILAATLAAFSLIGWRARRWGAAPLRSLDEWGLGGRSNGAAMTWFLVGGTAFTAYTYVALPALVDGTGGLGLFSLPYTILVWPLFFMVAPRLWSVARANRYVTAADVARGRYGSTALGIAVALTGLLAVLPYLTLQLLGISVVLQVAGLPGDVPLLVAFSLLAAATWRSGLRAPALTAVAKDLLVSVGLVSALLIIPGRLGGMAHAFALAGSRVPLVPPAGDAVTYVTLAVGSALALFLYPHTVTATLAAGSRRALRRSAIALPLFTLSLGLIAVLGVLAAAAGLRPSADGAPRALPELVQMTMPAPLAGILFASIAVGALVPSAVMAIGAANLFSRNVYRDWIRPDASPEQQLAVARIVSLLAKVGALVFVVGLRTDAAINLQLLGGVWILQTLPAVGSGLYGHWFHRSGLLAGWAAGMVAGTLLAASQGFVGVVPLTLGSLHLRAYPGLVALVVNLAVTVAATLLVRSLRLPDGPDRTLPVLRPEPAPLAVAGGWPAASEASP